MLRLNRLTGAALAALTLTTGANAADMPVYYEEPSFGGWYIRGDIGITNQFSDDIDSPYLDVIASPIVEIHESEWDASWFIGAGVGYVFNDSFRADFTFEYRFQSDFSGLITADDGADPIDFTNEYDGEKEEAVLLLNAYWDITTWNSITPYVGAGVGASWIKLSDFSDVDEALGSAGFSDDVESWNFAWALYAGLSYAINPQLSFDIGYRFLYLGEIETDDLVAADGDNDTYNPYNFDDIASHDIRIGLRYRFD